MGHILDQIDQPEDVSFAQLIIQFTKMDSFSLIRGGGECSNVHDECVAVHCDTITSDISLLICSCALPQSEV